MAMYHSWGSQNAWLRQIHGSNRLYVPRTAAENLGIGDDDWVWLISRTRRIKVQVRLMEGVNGDTVWTWNAIGKRAGARPRGLFPAADGGDGKRAQGKLGRKNRVAPAAPRAYQGRRNH